MAPKAAAKENLIGDDEDVLQAVILADSFNKRFRPLTAGKPRCLLPICNAPLLDWTFESLALAGVQEIFVICRSYAELVKAAVRDSRWSRPSSGIKIVCIVTAKETFTPGDAMRDIYTHGIISSDFVLVTGDLVSNIRIDEVVRVHKERRKTNKDAIMTMVVKESGASHRTRSKANSSVFVLDAETSECLHYEAVAGSPATLLAKIPREIIAEHPELEIRNDLIDCSIDVCSVDVPSLFQDNFDYGDIRSDFVHGILTSDLLMKNIYCYVAKEGYAARVQDTRSYDAVSKDILSRWTFPLVPDDNHPGGHVYEHVRGNKYIAKDNTVILSRTCKVGNNSLIGSSTQIYDNAQILASVIGRNCTIGANTIIRDSYIFDGTSIGPDCVIERSIVGSGVSIREESHIEKGCLIGEGIILGPSAHLVPFTRLSKKRSSSNVDVESDDEANSDVEELESTPQLREQEEELGVESNALVWPKSTPEDEDDEEEGEGMDRYINERLMRIGDDGSDLELSDPGTVTESEDEEDSSDEEDDGPGLLAGRGALSSSSLPLGAPGSGLNIVSADDLAETEFRNEVKQSLARAFEEGHSVDNAAVELKTLRMASNVPLIRVREAVVAGIVQQIKIVDGAGPQRKEIAAVIERWGDLINRIGGADPVETIAVLQTYCASSEHMPLFAQVLAALYQDDIIDENDVREWHSTTSAQGLGLQPGELWDNMRKCWAIGSRMVEQFDAQSSSEEDSSEDEAAPTQTHAVFEPQATAAASSSGESSGEDSEEGGEPLKLPEKQAAVMKATAGNSENGSEDESSSDEDTKSAFTSTKPATSSASGKPSAPTESSGSDSDDSEETPKTPSSAPSASTSNISVPPAAQAPKTEPPVAAGPVSSPMSSPVMVQKPTATYRDKAPADSDSEEESGSGSESSELEPSKAKVPLPTSSQTPGTSSGSSTIVPTPLKDAQSSFRNSKSSSSTTTTSAIPQTSTSSKVPELSQPKVAQNIAVGTMAAAAAATATAAVGTSTVTAGDESSSGEDESDEDGEDGSESESVVTGSVDGSAFTGSVAGSGTTGSELEDGSDVAERAQAV